MLTRALRSMNRFEQLTCALIALAGLSQIAGCGSGDSGSISGSEMSDLNPAESIEEGTQLGRWHVQPVRLSISKPLIIRWDSATGEVTQRKILGQGREGFRPVAHEVPPGASLDPAVVGRYILDVIPGRRGSALLRLDTTTGQVWLLHLNVKPRRWMEIPEQGSASKAARAAKQASQGARPDKESSTGADVEIATLELLVELLEDNETPQEVRAGMPGLIVAEYPKQATQALMPSLKDEDLVVVLSVIEALPLDDEGSSVTAIQPLLTHPDDRIAEAARLKLGGARE